MTKIRKPYRPLAPFALRCPYCNSEAEVASELGWGPARGELVCPHCHAGTEHGVWKER